MGKTGRTNHRWGTGIPQRVERLEGWFVMALIASVTLLAHALIAIALR